MKTTSLRRAACAFLALIFVAAFWAGLPKAAAQGGTPKETPKEPVLGGYLQRDRYSRRSRCALSLWHLARPGSWGAGHERQLDYRCHQCCAAQERGKEVEGVDSEARFVSVGQDGHLL